MTAIPIFILGRHRSGTTWVANILASIPGVYAVAHPAARGVHESAFFSHLVRHCNGGRTDRDLEAIKRLFERSQYFALTRVGRGPEIVGIGAPAYFRAVMDAAAAAREARFWLEKTPAHTLDARILRESYPDAQFVAVVRDYRHVVASNVHGFGEAGSPWCWFRQSAATAVYEKILARNAISTVRYESLVADYERTVHELMRKLGFDCDFLPRSAFSPNTSYRESMPAIRGWQQAAMRVGRALVLPLPGAVLEWAVARWRRTRRGSLPPWFFRSDDAAAVRAAGD
jgi:hypothetical protein